MAGFGPMFSGAPAQRASPYAGVRDEEKPRMVYVGNLAYSSNWQILKTHMEQAGNVEFAKVLTEDGSDTGRSRGTGYVRYSTEEEAKFAIANLRESELEGRNLLIDSWTGSGKGVPKGGAKGMGKGPGPRAGGGKGGGGFSLAGAGATGGVDLAALLGPLLGGAAGGGLSLLGGAGGKGAAGGGMRMGGKAPLNIQGNPDQLVYVGNLAYSCNWKDLKEHMSQAGVVEFSKVLTEDGTDSGRSRGTAVVRYSTAAEAQNAIAVLAETELNGRKILVDMWNKK